MKIAVLASGSGTILDAISNYGVGIDLVLVDRPCGAVGVAADHGIETKLLERKSFDGDFDRASYTHSVCETLTGAETDLVIFAGFGTVVTSELHERFPSRILNTHPSLLPSFPGWHSVKAAMDYGVAVSGCTVHVVTPEVDVGPILAQVPVAVYPSDSEATLHERIKTQERWLYPKVIEAFAKSLDVHGDGAMAVQEVRALHLGG